jgi:hypothetical protein
MALIRVTTAWLLQQDPNRYQTSAGAVMPGLVRSRVRAEEVARAQRYDARVAADRDLVARAAAMLSKAGPGIRLFPTAQALGATPNRLWDAVDRYGAAHRIATSTRWGATGAGQRRIRMLVRA